VRRLRLLEASYLRDWYRPSHLPFGSNHRKNRLVVRCRFSCGIELKWPVPRCYRNVTILLTNHVIFLSTCCSQDGGLFQRSNRSDVDLLSKQNASTYKNNSENHTVSDITSFFFNFVFYFRFTTSIKTRAKRTTWVSQFHISLWLAFLESFWALCNFGRHDSGFGRHDFGRDDFRATRYAGIHFFLNANV